MPVKHVTSARLRSRIRVQCVNIAREQGLNRKETKALIKKTTKSLLCKR